MIRVLIVDDHAAVRRGLRQLLGLLDDVVVVAEAEDGEQALKAVCRGALDLVLLDLNMPGTSGIELIECIRARDMRLPIVVLSMHGEPQIMERALHAGAQAYLVKGCDVEEIVVAVRRVAAEAHCSELPMSSPHRAGREQDLSLSPFGARVAALLDEGCAAEKIARCLGVCADTVERYIESGNRTRLTSLPLPTSEEKDDGSRTGGR